MPFRQALRWRAKQPSILRDHPLRLHELRRAPRPTEGQQDEFELLLAALLSLRPCEAGLMDDAPVAPLDLRQLWTVYSASRHEISLPPSLGGPTNSAFAALPCAGHSTKLLGSLPPSFRFR